MTYQYYLSFRSAGSKFPNFQSLRHTCLLTNHDTHADLFLCSAIFHIRGTENSPLCVMKAYNSSSLMRKHYRCIFELQLGPNKLDQAASSVKTKCTGLNLKKPTEIHISFDWTLPQILQHWSRQLGPRTEPSLVSEQWRFSGRVSSCEVGPFAFGKTKKQKCHHCLCFHKSLRVISTHNIQKRR